MALKPASVQLLLDKHKSRSNIRAALELVLGVPAACMVCGSTEIKCRQPGHLAEASRPCSRGQVPSWCSLGGQVSL